MCVRGALSCGWLCVARWSPGPAWLAAVWLCVLWQQPRCVAAVAVCAYVAGWLVGWLWLCVMCVCMCGSVCVRGYACAAARRAVAVGGCGASHVCACEEGETEQRGALCVERPTTHEKPGSQCVFRFGGQLRIIFMRRARPRS